MSLIYNVVCIYILFIFVSFNICALCYSLLIPRVSLNIILINQAPSWNDATKAFVGNNDVRFADINLSEASIRGEPYNPGAGG